MKTIILIEDDEFLQELYREILSQQFVIEIIGDGIVAKDRLLKGGWDMALVDLTLPGLSGIEVLEEVDKSKMAKGKIVVLTNSEDPALLTLAKKHSDGIIIKSSINPEELPSKIESFF